MVVVQLQLLRCVQGLTGPGCGGLVAKRRLQGKEERRSKAADDMAGVPA